MPVGSLGPQFNVGADFSRPPATPSTANVAASDTCTSSGACCYYPPDAGRDGGAPASMLSAGVISVADGASPLAALIPADAGAPYTTLTSSAWRSGDALSVSAAGGEIDSFAGSVTVPAPILFASAASWDTTDLRVSADLTFSWAPAMQPGSQVLLTLSGPSVGAQPGGVVECAVADSAGAMSVPAALLVRLGTAGPASLAIVRRNTASVTSDNATIHLVCDVGSVLTVNLQP